MLNELCSGEKVVGIKQLRKALRDDRAARVFVAQNADPRLVQPVVDLCREKNVPMEEVPTMEQLGEACQIQVGAAVAALLKS